MGNSQWIFDSHQAKEMGTQESKNPASNGKKNPRVIQSYHLENDYTFFFAEFNKRMLHLVKETPDLKWVFLFSEMAGQVI